MRRAAVAALTAGALVIGAGATVGVIALTGQDTGPATVAEPSESADSGASGTSTVAPGAIPAAEAFLADWVDDGRVVRRDEGGDTVSEGQAYGLLAAVVADDEASFDEIWDWTGENLMRADGLMAWRWDDGAIVDDEPASDADLDAARALVLAGDRFERPDLTEAGTAISAVILDRLTVVSPVGRVLLPGLWAAGRSPLPYNPSYASPAAYDVLSAATGDARWAELAEGSRAATSAILAGTELPPDWAQIRDDGSIEPMPGPLGTGLPVQYGYDAPRLLLRYAESCTPADVELTTSALPALSYQDEPSARLDLGGGALTDDRSPLAITARGAAYAASGDRYEATDDLALAADVAGQFPTYYGQAWVALASAMLTDPALGGCPQLGGNS